MRVLVVDDEEEVRSVVARALRADGHALTTASNLAAAREATSEAELIVLDLRLTDGFGLELCRELRADGVTTPILLLTALSAVSLRVEGLDAGADDFLAKPFAVAELRARVRALGRRGALPRGLVTTRGEVTLDFSGRHATRAGKALPITAREWAILDVLVKRGGRVVQKSELLESVWGESGESATNSLEVLVGRLRRKLGPGWIQTLRGEGYALSEENPS